LVIVLVVPGEGLEPTSLLRAEDFKSSASANSAIPALCLTLTHLLLPSEKVEKGRGNGGDERIRTAE
jgi:hypothetical protein